MRKEFVAPEINAVDLMPSECIMGIALLSGDPKKVDYKQPIDTSVLDNVAEQYDIWKGWI